MLASMAGEAGATADVDGERAISTSGSGKAETPLGDSTSAGVAARTSATGAGTGSPGTSAGTVARGREEPLDEIPEQVESRRMRMFRWGLGDRDLNELESEVIKVTWWNNNETW